MVYTLDIEVHIYKHNFVQNKFLLGLIFWRSWGVAPTIFKNTLEERVFEKMVSNLTVLEGIFEAEFQS